MPRGGKRPNSGRKAKSLEELQRTGRDRADRHSHLLTVPVPMSPPSMLVPESVQVGLQGPGRAFVESCWQEYQGWTGAELALLRQAARMLDDAEAAPTPRARQSAVRLFAAVVAQLRLEAARPVAAPNPWEQVHPAVGRRAEMKAASVAPLAPVANETTVEMLLRELVEQMKGLRSDLARDRRPAA